jgi:hypothetical protein
VKLDEFAHLLMKQGVRQLGRFLPCQTTGTSQRAQAVSTSHWYANLCTSSASAADGVEPYWYLPDLLKRISRQTVNRVAELNPG